LIWVLLRGLTRESRHWGDFPAVLEAAIPGARAVALDLPGCGALHRQRSPTSVTAMVERYRGQLDAAGCAPPFHLIGLSLGGMAAAAWAARHAPEVAACVLVNASMRPHGRWHERLRPGRYGTLIRLAAGGATDREREATVLRLTSATTAASPPLLDAWAAYRRDRPVSAANALRQLLAAAVFRGPATAPVPTLVLASEHDRLVDPACSRRLAAAWKVPLKVHPRAGHDIPLDDPAWVVAQVRDWSAALRR
jgi:pimeloyl-ACP methyl ester carboxylesterase